MTPSRALLLLLALALGACGREPEPEGPPPAQGREETRSIRNTEAIGYSGNAIADKVDAGLDANDQRKQELDRSLEGQE
jgi:hypothetical protein